MEKKGHFVLIHGASHGAWCWYKVIPQLKSVGHKVTAMDMAGAGIHPKQVHEVLSISVYFEPLMNFMASLQPEEKVILVGHSMGGYCISAAMERYPEKVAVAVFAAAYMASPTLPFVTISQQDLTLALTLVRHVGFFNDEESIKAVALTKEKYGTVPRVYIVCGKDNILKQDFQRWIVENSPPNEIKFALHVIFRQFTRKGVNSKMDKKCTFDNGPGSPPTSMLTGPNYFAYDVYQLSPPESLTILMANGGVTIPLQKEMGLLEHEMSQLQLEFIKLDTKLESRFKDLRDEFKGEIRSELHSLFEQYFGQSATSAHGMVQDRGKGILGTPPLGFHPRTVYLSPVAYLGHFDTYS
ncbi:hypothetical protein Goklo_008082 [Gossypium klotzschianum]|uniref:AB hydrolase-1 domain-containing protein n=1 Tax=Gossypium klotzschianum TaxID=34286 RepID=A0A7J8UYJ6_9ROSI|nr:hypothetical protein [Gossypium klotzschianum]